MIYPTLPISFISCWQAPNHREQSSIEPLRLPIAHRMIWCCSHFTYLSLFAEVFKQCSLKGSALIREDPFQPTVMHNILDNKNPYDRFCLLVVGDKSLRVPGKVVCNDQYIHITFLFAANEQEVHVNCL